MPASSAITGLICRLKAIEQIKRADIKNDSDLLKLFFIAFTAFLQDFSCNLIIPYTEKPVNNLL